MDEVSGEDVPVRRFRLFVLVLFVVVAASSGEAAGRQVVVELTVADLDPSSSSSSTWGWWNPSKYDEWTTDNGSNLGLADARLLVSGSDYTVLLAGEWYPKLEATGSFEDPQSGEVVVDELSWKVEAYDLGIGQYFGRDRRTGVMPWVGATYIRISEELAHVSGPGSGSDGLRDTSSAGLWGVVAGADAGIQVLSVLDVTGRFLFRWASGTRKAVLEVGDPPGGTAEVSDSTDITMWGLDLGVRWHASKAVMVEGGWRYRDWTLSGGPASYGGPFVKAIVNF
jgi:hypothetical protein